MNKLILKDIWINRGKFIIIFLSIVLTTISITGYFSFEKTVVNTRIQQFRDQTLNTQIYISTIDGNFTGFNEDQIRDKVKKINNVEHILSRCSNIVKTTLPMNEIYLYGIDISEQQKIYPFEIMKGSIDLKQKNGAVCSESFARENKLKIGDKINFFAKNKAEAIIVEAIVKDNAFFLQDGCTVICNIDFVRNIFLYDNEVNRIDIEIKELDKINETVAQLKQELSEYQLEVSSKYQEAYYESYVGTIQLALKLFLVFNLIISFYIIYSLFEVYIIQNVKLMGIYRSIGFSKNDYKIMILVEGSIVIGIGILMGMLLSYPCISLLLEIIIHEDIVICIEYLKNIISCLAIYLISIISIRCSLKKYINISIVEVIKNAELVTKKKMYGIKVMCCSFLVLAIGICNYYFADTVWLNLVLLISTVVIFMLIGSGIYKILAIFITKATKRFQGSVWLIGKQINKDVNKFGQSLMLISLVIMVFSVSDFIKTGLNKSFQNVYKGAEIQILGTSEDYERISEYVDKEYKEDEYTIQYRKVINVSNKQIELSGINSEQYGIQEYEEVISGSRKETFQKLNCSNTVILSKTLARELNKKVNEEMDIEGRKFKIVGFVNTFENKGMIAFTSAEYFDLKSNKYDYYMILINGKHKEIAEQVNEVEAYLKNTNSSVYKIKDVLQDSLKDNLVIVNIIKVLCAFMFFISLIGLHNNVTMTLISNMRTFITYKTVGISSANIVKTQIIEYLLLTFISQILGFLMGLIVLPIINNILSYYIGSISMSIECMEFIKVGCAVVLIIAMDICYLARKYIRNGEFIQEIRKFV